MHPTPPNSSALLVPTPGRVMLFCSEALRPAVCCVVDALEVRGYFVQLRTGRNAGAVLQRSRRRCDADLRVVFAPEALDHDVHRKLLHRLDPDKRGDVLLAGSEYGRVRAMINARGEQVTEVGPSEPVEVLGLSGTPNAGDEATVVDDERKAREVASLRVDRERETKLARQQAAKLENMLAQMKDGEQATVRLLLKTDVQGSCEALSDALTKLGNEEVRVDLISTGVGGINESDVNLAHASQATMIGFNVRADAAARRLVEEEGVDLRYYSVIYDVIDDVKAAINGLLSPEIRETIVGIAEVRDVFRSSQFGAIAGCVVSEGVVKRTNPIRVLRENVVIYEGELESLRRFKDDVNEVRAGTECGIGVKNYNDVKPGDQIEVYERTVVARTI